MTSKRVALDLAAFLDSPQASGLAGLAGLPQLGALFLAYLLVATLLVSLGTTTSACDGKKKSTNAKGKTIASPQMLVYRSPGQKVCATICFLVYKNLQIGDMYTVKSHTDKIDKKTLL